MTAPHLSPETAVAHAYGLTRASAEATEIERHVETCAECSQRLHRLRSDREALAEALRPEPIPAVEPAPALRRRRPWVESLAAALCLAAVGFALFGSWRERQPAGQSEAAVQRDLKNLGSDDPALRQEAFERLMKQRGGLEAELRRALEQARDPEVKARLDHLLRPHEMARRGGTASAQADGSLRFWLDHSASGFPIGPERPPAPVTPLAWSPDGKRLAYRTQEDPNKPVQLHVLDVLSNESVRVSLDLLQTPVWSPDATKLAFASTTGISIASGADWAVKPLVTEGLPCFFSKDAGQLYLWRPSRIECLDLVSRRSVLVADAAGPGVVSADGATLYYFGPADGRVSYGVSSFPLLRLDLASGTVRVLKEGASIGETNQTLKSFPDRPAVSPKGDYVAWIRTTADMSEIRLLYQPDGSLQSLDAAGAPAWAPSGLRLAFENRFHETQILDLGDARIWQHPGTSPVWAPQNSNR
jgi:WD40-like Beta Propeller Repeat